MIFIAFGDINVQNAAGITDEGLSKGLHRSWCGGYPVDEMVDRVCVGGSAAFEPSGTQVACDTLRSVGSASSSLKVMWGIGLGLLWAGLIVLCLHKGRRCHSCFGHLTHVIVIMIIYSVGALWLTIACVRYYVIGKELGDLPHADKETYVGENIYLLIGTLPFAWGLLLPAAFAVCSARDEPPLTETQ